MRTFPVFYSPRHLVCTSLLSCSLLSGPFLPKLSADGIGIWSVFGIILLTVNVVSILLGERFLPFTVFFFFFFNPPFVRLGQPLGELGEVFILMEGDYVDGIPACVIY